MLISFQPEEDSLEENGAPVWSRLVTPSHIPNRLMFALGKCLPEHVSLKRRTSHHQQMNDKEVLVHIHNGILLSHKKECI